MERQCRYVPLSKHPLVLVLAQVRFSPIRQMERYVAEIQEEFRRHEFPIERSEKVQEVTFGLTAKVPVQVAEQQRWEYRTRDEGWGTLVTENSVLLQTTAYGRFEEFAAKLERSVRTVLETTEHDRFGVIERIGLRYVDVVQPRPSEDFRFYLRPGFHGVADEVFQGSAQLHMQATGQTVVGDDRGVMLVRIIQNDQGILVPPDLVAAGPRPGRAQAGELVTLIDMEHYMDGRFEPDVDWLMEKAYRLHDHLVETFHDNVVTERAVEVWQ